MLLYIIRLEDVYKILGLDHSIGQYGFGYLVRRILFDSIKMSTDDMHQITIARIFKTPKPRLSLCLVVISTLCYAWNTHYAKQNVQKCSQESLPHARDGAMSGPRTIRCRHMHNLMRCADLCPSHCEEVPWTVLRAMSGSCTNKYRFRLLLETKSTFHPRAPDCTDFAGTLLPATGFTCLLALMSVISVTA